MVTEDLKETLQYAKEKELITDDGVVRIEEYVTRLTANKVPVIFNLRHLRKLLKIQRVNQDCLLGKRRNESYNFFHLPKKSGGYRTIEAPDDELKTIQTWVKENILDKVSLSDNAKGFKKDACILDNARPHTQKELVINIDVKDFFPSIKYNSVFRIFNYLGYTHEVSHLLTKICTNTINVLPQGAPTSPVISNIVCLKLDKRFSKLAESWGADFTRYADDITFSGDKGLKKIMPILEKILLEEGFTINPKKIRLQYNFHRQEVTGLLVNSKVSVSKKLIKEIENAIFFSKKYGVINHMKHIKCERNFYKEHLYGLAYFIKMIEKDKGEKYLRQLDDLTWSY